MGINPRVKYEKRRTWQRQFFKFCSLKFEKIMIDIV